MANSRWAGLVMVGAALGAVMSAPTPAFAAEGDGVADSGEIVLWLDQNFGGPIHDDADNNDNYRGDFFVNSRRGLNDEVTALQNWHLDLPVRVFVDASYSGPYLSVLRFGQTAGTSSWSYPSVRTLGLNDEFSSHLFG